MIRVATAYTSTAAALLAFGWLSGIEDGPLAVVQLLSPHFALGTVAAIPIAAATRSRSLAFAVGATMLQFVLRFGAEWNSPGVEAASGELTVATWNIQAGSGAGEVAVAVLGAALVDIVALQELTPDVAAAIESDAMLTARYPYRVLEAREGVSGAGSLSRFPDRIGRVRGRAGTDPGTGSTAGPRARRPQRPSVSSPYRSSGRHPGRHGHGSAQPRDSRPPGAGSRARGRGHVRPADRGLQHRGD